MYYLTHAPKEISPSTKCIIMLHGVGSNEADLFSLRESFGDNTIIYSLRGPFTLVEGSYAWYPVDFSTGKPVYQSEDVVRGYSEIIECIDEVSLQHSISPENIFLMGFSQGAIMSYYTLWRSPEEIGGIIGLSGRILDEIEISEKDKSKYTSKRIFVGHGMIDQVISYSATEKVKQYINAMGVKSDIHTYSIGHTISASEIEDIKNWINL